MQLFDTRTLEEFKLLTFSNFKKNDVKIALLSSLIESNIEPACFWSAELICAGSFTDLWDIIILFYSKYVHIGNPRYAIYLYKTTILFKQMIQSCPDITYLRNNMKLRSLFAEIICVLCLSPRKHKIVDVKIKPEEFDLTLITDRFKAPNITFGQQITRTDDPPELFVAVNELAYSVTESCKNTIMAFYWVEWITEFGQKCKQKKKKCLCERRSYIPVDPKHQMDLVWIIWDVFLNEVKSRPEEIHKKIINALLHIFILRYCNTFIKKRKYILYYVIYILTSPFDENTEIIKDKEKCKLVVDNIDKIYKQIKKSENNPDADVPELTEKEKEKAKTAEKLNILFKIK